MSDFGNILSSLRTMNSTQLLFAFMASSGYALAQGGLVRGKGSRAAWLLAATGAAGFVLLSEDWTAAVMLMAFAVAGIGCFVGIVWLLSRVMGLPTAGSAPNPVSAAEQAAGRPAGGAARARLNTPTPAQGTER